MIPRPALLFSTINGIIRHQRHISVTSRLRDTFNIQDEADFKSKVVESKKPVVVDFHATWCNPCKMLMPRLETAVAATKDGVDLAKVDIDELADIAMEYGVEAVPTVMTFKNGKPVEKFVGLQDDDKIAKLISAIQ